MCVAGDYIEKANKKGVSGRQLAIRSNIDPKYMSSIKQCKRPMKQELIEQLAQVLGVDPLVIEVELIAEKRKGNYAKRLVQAAKKSCAAGLAAVVILATSAFQQSPVISEAYADSDLPIIYIIRSFAWA